MNEKTILIVEDERVNLNLLSAALKNEYAVKIAKDGNQALKLSKTIKPDLMILDILMPGITGYDVCKTIKEDPDTKDIPIIFITAMSDSGYETKGLDLGAVDYITKPICIPIVKARVKHHLEKDHYKKQLEKMVALRTKELVMARDNAENAIRAKSDFIMNIGHEMTAPLNGIISKTKLIAGMENEQGLHEVQNIIELFSKDLLQKIEQILDYAISEDNNLLGAIKPAQQEDAPKSVKPAIRHKSEQLHMGVNFNNEPDLIMTIKL